MDAFGAFLRSLLFGTLAGIVVLLAVGISGVIGYGAREYQAWKEFHIPATSDGAVRVQPTLTVPVGEPAELRAETLGRRVIWMSLDPEVVIREKDNKSIWVIGKKVGEYRLVAWSAVNNLPTGNAVCIVKVEPQKGEER